MQQVRCRFDSLQRQEGEAAAEFLYRCSEEQLGVQSMVTLLLSEAISRIEQKHKCKAQLRFNVMRPNIKK